MKIHLQILTSADGFFTFPVQYVSRRLRHASLLVQILLFRGKPAADMALRLVQIQNFPGFRCQSRVYLHETFGHVLMYRALADTEGLRCLSHRGIIVDDIVSDADGTLFNIILQRNTSWDIFYYCMKYP